MADENIRAKSRESLKTTLSERNSDAFKADRIAYEIETSVLRQHEGETNNEYRASMRSHLYNLRNNPDLGRQLLAGSLVPADFAGLSSDEMATRDRARENDRIRNEGLENTIGVDEIESKPRDDSNVESGQGTMSRSGAPGLDFETPI